MQNEIRVRFAPSPTGYLHVGGLRTALYNFLYARKTGGKFLLRIEDTDRNRYVEGAIENLISALQLCGIDYDEGPEKEGEVGPYLQSARTEIYQKYIKILLEKDAAYHCFCSSEDLDKMRQQQKEQGLDPRYDGRCRKLSQQEVEKRIAAGESYVIREKTPETGEITFYDIVRDKVTIPWETVDDQILMKSDGFPTYHLANVIDDHLMKITHVIRGEEWLSSVPKHLFLYQALSWKPPKLAHLPLLLNEDKSKLSKRQNDVAVEDYLQKGYLPEALINFIALLGWHPAKDKEIYSLEELKKEFSLKRISKAGAVFNVEKLDWMNGQYLRNLSLDRIAEAAKPFFAEAGLDTSNTEKYKKVIDLVRGRVHTLQQIPNAAIVFYQQPQLDAAKQEVADKESSQQVYKFWLEKLPNLDIDSSKQINTAIKEISQETGVKGKNLYMPLRVALYGDFHGPEIPELIQILGKDETLARVEKLLK
ncbi:MAG: nondiscriminating glutamyl-tRNA synthetase [Candidatus Cloacimonadota bacterium]|jgi:glutamyl-tRNA synthetase|nr:nondiscriminating glutamyl-tRNA synthetase [Candidatus Cloacimonadota bacterium]